MTDGEESEANIGERLFPVLGAEVAEVAEVEEAILWAERGGAASSDVGYVSGT